MRSAFQQAATRVALAAAVIGMWVAPAHRVHGQVLYGSIVGNVVDPE